MTKPFWPEFIFDPINLLNYPQQYEDYMNDYAAERRKANSLKLKPTKRPKPASRILIEPARGVSVSIQSERIQNCIDQRNGRRF